MFRALALRLFVVVLVAAHACADPFTLSATSLTAPANTDRGRHIGISGNLALVSDMLFDGGAQNQGRVRAWTRDAETGTWSVTQTISAQSVQQDAWFGDSLAVDGEWALIGNSYFDTGGYGSQVNEGRVEVHKFNGGTGLWEFVHFLVDPTGAPIEHFGVSVDLDALSGYAAVGSPLADRSTPSSLIEAGAVLFFELNGLGTVWEYKSKHFASNAVAGGLFAYGVGVSGNYTVVGHYKGGTNDAGGAALFKRDTGGTDAWSEVQAIANPDPEDFDYMGFRCAMDGEWAVVGAHGVDESGKGGEVYVYQLNTQTDALELKQRLSPTGANADFGFGVAIEGSLIAVGARADADGGKAYVYERGSDDVWALLEVFSEPSSVALGQAVGISSGTLIVGDPAYGGSSNGRSYFYTEIDENPLRCGSYDSTNQRYFYDDGTGCEITPTVSDACYYSVGDLQTTDEATLRVDLSELKADGGTDYIYLAFDVPDKYYNTRLVFADAAATECEHVNWEQVSATRDVDPLSSCFTTFVYRLPWSEAYSAAGDKCGWVRDDSGANVKLVLDFAVEVTEDLSTNRAGDTLRRQVEFSMPVQVEFPVQVVAQAVNVTVFGEVRVLAVVTEQSVTIDEPTEVATMKVRLFTEVQAPFELHTISETSTLPTGVTVATTFTDVNVLKTTACSDPAAICAATWEFEYETPSVAGGSNPCEFDGVYEVSFVVGCSDENANGDCPIDDATDSVSIQFSVDSNNHCPSVIDSVDLSATLEVYDTQARTGGEQDDFVGDGTTDNGQTPSPDDWQVAYFAAPTKSDQVAIDETELNQVWIIRGDASKVVLLDADNVHNDAPYNSVGAITCTPVQQPGDGNDADKATVTLQTGCDPTNPAGGTYNFDFKHGEGGNAAATAFSTPIFQFDVRTDSEGFDMADDAIETMTVHAVIDVRYANAAKRSAGGVLNEQRTDFTSVERTFQTNGQAASASSSSSSLFGMSSMMVYAAAATLAVVVVGVLVVVLKKPSQPAMEKVESSTELASTAV